MGDVTMRKRDWHTVKSTSIWCDNLSSFSLFMCLYVCPFSLSDYESCLCVCLLLKYSTVCCSCMGSGAITVTGLLVEKVQIITH
jgi:hypothetical protein